MGIIWRLTMPLLTTLAALVIIVHSAEENFDTQSELGPMKIHEFTDYELPWRVMDEPGIPVDGRNTNYETADDDTPKHRRVGRKRKRQRNSHSAEELIYAYEPIRPYYDMELETMRKTTETSNKRRQIESNPKWSGGSDIIDIQRSIARKVHRKQLPVPTWPVHTPFKYTTIVLDELASHVGSTEKINIDADDHSTEMFVELPSNKKQLEYKEINSSLLKLNLESGPNEEIILKTGHNTRLNPTTNTFIIRDKSLSDFSSEVYTAHNKETVTLATDTENAKQVEQEISLKDILKQTSGSSLSEILQRNNVTLTDLLRGKENAVSVFRSPVTLEDNKPLYDEALENNKSPYDIIHDAIEFKPESNVTKVDGMASTATQDALLINLETKNPFGADIRNASSVLDLIQATYEKNTEESTTITSTDKSNTKVNRRLYQQNPRRRMYNMTPMRNNTHKGQLSRDLISLNSRKYAHHRKNVTKSHHWKDMHPTTKSWNGHRHNNVQNQTENLDKNTGLNDEFINLSNNGEQIIYITPDETTNITGVENDQIGDIILQHDINSDNKYMEVRQANTLTEKHIVDEKKDVTEKSPVVHRSRPTAIATGLRKHAFNNRLTRKRLKSKNTTTEGPQEDLTKYLYGMGNLVSSSEFIERTQKPAIMSDPIVDKMNEPITTTEDSVPNENDSITETDTPPAKSVIPTVPTPLYTTTEENAKIEIEEILRDTNAASRLCAILLERNMTLNELVKHRERGSSYVHLADIFHNASREPNPPEPFLSKSLLEPISKETYPLRALLDANSHEPNLKASNSQPDFVHKIDIPVGIDFRNNVNKYAEKTSVMTSLDKFPKSNDTPIKDAEKKKNENPIINVNRTNENKLSNTGDGRMLDQNTEDDVVSWNEIFSLMGRNNIEHESEGDVKPYKNFRLEEDADGDGVIILEDLQHLKDFGSNVGVGSTEEVDMDHKMKHKGPLHYGSRIFDDVLTNSNTSHTKSVTVATASIIGLAIILFLLTYAAFKWKQQRSILRKKSNYGEDHIPTPVFENRKGHMHNSSIRSISPMIPTSNHYTIENLDSQTGKESPDYAWDSLRKPFQ